MEKTTVCFGDMLALRFLTSLYQGLSEVLNFLNLLQLMLEKKKKKY